MDSFVALKDGKCPICIARGCRFCHIDGLRKLYLLKGNKRVDDTSYYDNDQQR
jgi:hypothetical protein